MVTGKIQKYRYQILKTVVVVCKKNGDILLFSVLGSEPRLRTGTGTAEDGGGLGTGTGTAVDGRASPLREQTVS